MENWRKWTWAVLVSIPFAGQAQADSGKLDRDMTGPRSQVLVLGTIHLRGMPESFRAAALDGLLDRLVSFKPDIITIEAKSGEECDLAARHPAKYGSDYCVPTDAARTATGLDIPAALAEVDKTLKAWAVPPSPPTSAQRRHLAALFLAANDRASAYVQWLQLPVAERHAGDGVSAALVDDLARIATTNNEDYQVAAPVAARLGLQRVYAVDNHTGDNIDVADGNAFGQAIKAAWKAGREELNEREKQQAILTQSPDLLPLYRYVNSPEHQRVLTDVNISASLRAKSPEGYPQMWVAGWEIRNLRMVANIRETFRERPGARVLTIVGASHKPLFDGWLGQMQGVNIVDVAAVLK